MNKNHRLSVRKAICFFFLSSFSVLSYAQKIVAEVPLSGLGVHNLKGIVSGDSIFLLYKQQGSSKNTDMAVQIGATGKVREIELGSLNEKFLCGIISNQKTTHYYFFEPAKNEVIIKALICDEVNKTQKISDDFLELPGKLLGSYIDDDLYLICASKNDFTVRLIRIQDLKIVNEKIFKISSDLVKDKNTQIAFMQIGQDIKPDLASATTKMIKDGDFIYIISDEPFIEYGDRQRPFKTIINRLDLKTGEVVNKIFYEDNLMFSTFVYHNRIYRIIKERGIKIEIFAFNGTKPIYSKSINKEPPFAGEMAYTRWGKNNVVKKHYSIKTLLKGYTNYSFFIIPDSLPSGDIVLTLGTHYQEGSAGAIGGTSIITMMISAVAAAVVQELREKPSLNSYFYMAGTLEKGFEYQNTTGLIKQQIDDYEISLFQTVKWIKYKGYLHEPAVSYAIYQLGKSTKLQVVKFESPLKAQGDLQK